MTAVVADPVFTDREKRAIRDNYPVTRNLTYLNHAAVGTLSRQSVEAMESHARGQCDFGMRDWRLWSETVERLRGHGARLLGADPSDVAILKNTSEGLSLVASGLPWEAGDNVVFSDMEFPSNSLPWEALRTRGVEVRRVQTLNGAFSSDDVAALVDQRTRVVSISSVSFHNGFRPDLAPISDVCRKNGAHLVVDAIQSLGAITIDVRSLGISFLAADGHKWMLGPEGVALFYASPEAREELAPWPVGWRSLEEPQVAFDSGVGVTRDARRFEAGVVNTNGAYSLEASLGYLLEIGMERIEREVRRLSQLLASQLEASGWEIITPVPGSSGIVTARPRGVSKSLDGLDERLEREGLSIAVRMGAMRFAPHFYNDEADIERAVAIATRIVS